MDVEQFSNIYKKNMSIIEVEHLSKQFTYYTKDKGLRGSVKNLFHREKLVKEAVDDISFQIEQGEIVGFLGPNGAGKTTTLKMLSGIMYPTQGNAHVMGYIPWERKKQLKQQFSIVMGQKSQLWWDLPAIDAFYLNKQIYEVDDKHYNSVVEELSKLLNVKDLLKVQVRRLSLGERMKMELIASMIHSPKIIYLDEPTIGLDLLAQKSIRDFLKYYNETTKCTIILTSHYMEDIVELCERTMIINRGKLVYDGLLNNVNECFYNKKIVKLKFSSYIPKEKLDFAKICSYDGYNAEFEIEKSEVNQFMSHLFIALPISDCNIEDIPIADVVADIYKEQ